MTQTKKTGTLSATRKGGLGTKPKNKRPLGSTKTVGLGKMRPGRTGENDTKVKNKTFTYEK